MSKNTYGNIISNRFATVLVSLTTKIVSFRKEIKLKFEYT